VSDAKKRIRDALCSGCREGIPIPPFNPGFHGDGFRIGYRKCIADSETIDAVAALLADERAPLEEAIRRCIDVLRRWRASDAYPESLTAIEVALQALREAP
jgi:hypothetical protein